MDTVNTEIARIDTFHAHAAPLGPCQTLAPERRRASEPAGGFRAARHRSLRKPLTAIELMTSLMMAALVYDFVQSPSYFGMGLNSVVLPSSSQSAEK